MTRLRVGRQQFRRSRTRRSARRPVSWPWTGVPSAPPTAGPLRSASRCHPCATHGGSPRRRSAGAVAARAAELAGREPDGTNQESGNGCGHGTQPWRDPSLPMWLPATPRIPSFGCVSLTLERPARNPGGGPGPVHRHGPARAGSPRRAGGSAHAGAAGGPVLHAPGSGRSVSPPPGNRSRETPVGSANTRSPGPEERIMQPINHFGPRSRRSFQSVLYGPRHPLRWQPGP